MLPGFLVRLLSSDPDEFLEDVTHLSVVHLIGGQVDSGEPLEYEIKEVLFGHFGDLYTEIEPLHDPAHIRREPVDVAVQVWRKLVWIIEQPGKVQFGEVVERVFGDLRELVPDDALRFGLQCRVCLQDFCLCWGQNAVKTAQDCQRENHLAVFVPSVRTAQQVADAPDEVGKFEMRFGGHVVLSRRTSPVNSRSNDNWSIPCRGWT